MHTAIADGGRVSDTIRKVMVNPGREAFALNERRCKFETLCRSKWSPWVLAQIRAFFLYSLPSLMAARSSDNPPLP